MVLEKWANSLRVPRVQQQGFRGSKGVSNVRVLAVCYKRLCRPCILLEEKWRKQQQRVEAAESEAAATVTAAHATLRAAAATASAAADVQLKYDALLKERMAGVEFDHELTSEDEVACFKCIFENANVMALLRKKPETLTFLQDQFKALQKEAENKPTGMRWSTT